MPLACAAGEQHTLGAEALYAALVEHGMPARMPGSAVPDVALLHAVHRLQPVGGCPRRRKTAPRRARCPCDMALVVAR